MATARSGPVYTYIHLRFPFFFVPLFARLPHRPFYFPRSIRPEIFLWLMQELCSHCTSQPPTFRRPYTTPFVVHIRTFHPWIGNGGRRILVHLQALDSPQGDLLYTWLHVPSYIILTPCTWEKVRRMRNSRIKPSLPFARSGRFGNRSFLEVSRRNFFSSFSRYTSFVNFSRSFDGDYKGVIFRGFFISTVK